MFVKLVLIILLILVIVQQILIFQNKKKQKQLIAECREKSNREIIQLMQIYRHDWQNYLQIIFGYVTLKKYDQIPNYIEKINSISKQHSIIGSFHNANLATYLYTLPINYPLLSYDLEIDDSMEILTKANYKDRLIYQGLKRIVDLLYITVKDNNNHHLIISMTAYDNKIIIDLEYEGNIDEVFDEILLLKDSFTSRTDCEQLLIDLHNEEESIIELHIQL